jgi:8-hydroxy-5-deazaflavin:NADPH oxidoreductase
MKKIGIIGSGVVAKTLAHGLIKNGYQVMLGTRNSVKLEELKKEFGSAAQVGNFESTGSFAEIILLAVKGTAAKSALELTGLNHLIGKTIIDTTNPIADAPPENGVLKYFTSLDKSLMEELQSAFPEAHFVKAFNSIGNAFMVNPDFNGLKPTMFICGNNGNSKNEVIEILDKFGWETEDMGGAESARAIEPLCMLWCIPGIRETRWMHAFKLLKK